MEEKTISNSRRCYKQWLWFMVLFMSFSVIYVDAVWPMPQMISSSMARYTLNPREFIFQYSSGSSAQPGCSLLDSAFERYYPLIFTDYRKHKCLEISLESFSQLVYQDDFGEYFVNETEIEDFPRFQFRGILLDTSRHYLPLHAILKTLDAMSYNKFNVFHWHIVDDPSFPYQSSTFPDLSSKGAFHPLTHVYTQIDVKRVIAHARLRGIRVLAEFDSPGHTQSWGKGQPGLLTPCYKGTVPSGTFGPVNPANSSSYQFMTRLFKEVTSVFPDSYVHLGGDEVDFTCWKSNPDVRGFMLKMGFGTDYTKLESYYMENMVNITKGLNKTAIVWQDVFDYHEKIPVDTVLHIWKGSPGQIQQELSSITLAGYRVILAAPWYINHIDYGQDWEKYYTIQPLNFTGTEQQKTLVIGGEVCMWGEYVDATNLSPRLWPRASAAGERLWSDEKMTSSVIDAFPRLVDFRCRLLRYRVIVIMPNYFGYTPNVESLFTAVTKEK
uniref:Beta-hexosaminidase n=1 Tax=Oncorhynchus tshawytscha TaxID=74940 RepID=A0AAZ3NQ97_ONCTS